jgi:hypothetical protein
MYLFFVLPESRFFYVGTPVIDTFIVLETRFLVLVSCWCKGVWRHRKFTQFPVKFLWWKFPKRITFEGLYFWAWSVQWPVTFTFNSSGLRLRVGWTYKINGVSYWKFVLFHGLCRQRKESFSVLFLRVSHSSGEHVISAVTSTGSQNFF